MAKQVGYYLTESDAEVLNRVLREYRNTPKQPIRRQEPEEHMAPEVYIAYADSLPPFSTAGTASIDTSTPSKGKCNIYRIIDDNEGDGPILVALCDLDCFKQVYNVSDQDLSGKFFPVVRDKFGHWLAVSGGSGSSLVGIMLAEDHPGRGNLFNVYLGTRSGFEWVYDCNNTYKCIDHRFGVPYPEIYATGLAMWIDGTTLELVALDCVSPDEPCDTGTATTTATP
jgi:hypothetical protein